MTGRLTGVGVGPGDPELMTVKAARLIGEAGVVAFYSARHRRSHARTIAAPYLRAGQVEEPLVYPVTTEASDAALYERSITEFHDSSATRVAAHLDAGLDVVVLNEGDPLFYGSYMHLHERLAHRYETLVVPGVTSVSGAAAAAGRPLVQHAETLTVLPGLLPLDELAARLEAADAVAIMKLGRSFPNVRAALECAGRLDEALYVEHATTEHQRVEPLAGVDPSDVPYFSMALVPGRTSRARDVVPVPQPARHGSVAVVGLGPGGVEWTTPEVGAALADAQDIVGYSTYVRRVTARPGQRVHESDNTEEAERAAFALALAHDGRRVVVVSSGDPGVFGMAAAVAEVAALPEWQGVDVRVLPGVTAAHAAASRVGAPLGHDYCVLSLSDRLKPWEVVEQRLDAAAAADLAIAIYNPASKTRTWQVGAARDVLLRHRKPDTPVVVACDVGGPDESIRVTTLADLDPDVVDMRTILLVGSSQTSVVTRDDGSSIVWTPRRYQV